MGSAYYMNDTLDNIILSQYGEHYSNVINSQTSSKDSFNQSTTFLSKNTTICDIAGSDIKVDDSIFINEVQSQKDSQECKPNTSQITSTQSYKLINKLPSDKYLLAAWNLPKLILEKYEKRGVTRMFPWQVDCLHNKNLLQKSANLIYSAPTSAGKTLVSEILAIKAILERKKKVIFVLPFVSVVREKMFYFQDILGTSGVRVEGFMGSHNPPGGFEPVQLAVCTIEKANSIINRLLEENLLNEIGAVVIDELHLLGDFNRGYLLELMLTKLQYMTIQHEDISLQIIGMSATLPNLELLGKWLKAEVYVTDFRPIPLEEKCLVENEMYSNTLKFEKKLLALPELKTDTDNILQLCVETIGSSCSVLIFCPTKNWCESLAQQIAMAFWQLGCSPSSLGIMLREQLNGELLGELLEQLKRCPVGLDEVLQKTIAFGVAFHHAGLTLDERDIIESAFRNGIIRVLVATSTLSSGVNLPARRVIIRTPIFHRKCLNKLQYRQMIGRAGRMGRDTCGESILICHKADYELAKQLLEADLEPIQSCLVEHGRLKRALLEVIASGVATKLDDIKLFTKTTLWAISLDDNDDLKCALDDSLDFLLKNEFIRLQESDDGDVNYVATSLGKACLSSSMAPEDGLTLFYELEKARQCFVLETELHLIYSVTPFSICNQWGNLDWMLFLEIWEKLPTSMKRVGELVGVREFFIYSGTRNSIKTDNSKAYQMLQIHKRFFTALALQDLVNETPITQVCKKFGCNRGMLQSLQQSASTFAGMLGIFSKKLGWSTMEILISQFQDRLQFGVNRDLLDLMRLSLLNGIQARALYNGGVQTLAHLASSDVCTVEDILHKIGPFESAKDRDGEADKSHDTKNVWLTGKEGLTEKEAALLLVTDARRYLQLELGLEEAKWKKLNLTDSINESVKESNCFVNDSLESQFSMKLELSTDLEKSKISSQSLFGDSFELMAHQETEGENTISQRNLYNTKNSGDSGLDFENCSFLEKAFLSDFDLELNKDSSSDLINSSQSINDSPFEKKRRDCGSIDSLSSSIEESFLINQHTQKKKRKILERLSSSPNYVLSPKATKPSKTDDFSKLQIVDVCRNQQLFKTFYSELLDQKTVAISLGCSRILENKPMIGENIIKLNTNGTKNQTEFSHKSLRLHGIAFSWGSQIAYYISFEDETVTSNSLKLKMMTELLNTSWIKCRMFDCKEQIKTAKFCCKLDFNCIIEDPKVGDWLLDPDEKEKSLEAMILNHAPELVNLIHSIGGCKSKGSVGLDLDSSAKPRFRAALEAVATWHLCDEIYNSLEEQDSKMIKTFKKEMMSILCLSQMELNGIGVDAKALQELIDLLKNEMQFLENNAYSLAGRRFSFSSSNDIAKALGMYRGRKFKTNKETLERQESPIANLILEWRKLNGTLKKMIYPLISKMENDRIYGVCITHTSTGRISMHEPNLQTVPKDFEIVDSERNLRTVISCRQLFIPAQNHVFLSADYCQLELRILAHLSQDNLLCSVMRTDEDVFKTIAAKWKNIAHEKVDGTIRQQAKQLCYGIIYGMGNKALAEQLSVSLEEAEELSNAFFIRYPNIKLYTQRIIENCQNLGFVETLAGRRRYMSHINHENPTIQNQTRRSAINTVIQGSAADIAKVAMITIQNNFRNKFLRPENAPKLVLQLHDEFIYEIPKKHLMQAAIVLKESMEEAVRLSIPFPVKLKSGPTWSNMAEFPIED